MSHIGKLFPCQRNFRSTNWHNVWAVARNTSGFSLVELMVVITIVILMLSLSIGAFKRAAQGDPVENALGGVAAGLELARQTAIAQNTFTWVRLASSKDDNGGNVVGMAIYSSLNGDLMDSNAGVKNYRLISKVEQFPSVVIGTPSDLSSSKVKDRLPLSGSTAQVGSPLESSDRLSSVPLPKAAQELWSRASGNGIAVVMFTPRGEAALDSAKYETGSDVPLYQAMQLAMMPQRGSRPSDLDRKSISAIWVNGITGQPTVYQPGL